MEMPEPPSADTFDAPSWRTRFFENVWSLCRLVCLATALGFAGAWWWVFELAAHFRVQYAVALAAGLAVLTIGRQWRRALISAGFCAVNAWLFAADFWPAPPADPAASSFRAMLINVYAYNRQYSRVIEAIRSERPDIIVINEFTANWENALAALRDDYPHFIGSSAEWAFGIALYSKRSFLDAKIVPLFESPAIHAVLDSGGSPVHIFGVHPYPPSARAMAASRNRQLERLGAEVASVTEPKLILGDLNVSPWSPHFSRLLRAAGVRDSRTGFGLQTSWPTDNPLLRIPIDHCLVSPEIVVKTRRIGPNVGSDHFPVILDLAVLP